MANTELSRREFLTMLAVGSGAALLSACGVDRLGEKSSTTTTIEPWISNTPKPSDTTIPPTGTPTNTPESTSTSTSEPTPTQEPAAIRVDEENPYKIEFIEVGFEEMKGMSDEQLLAMSPELDAGNYYNYNEAEDPETLRASEVIRVHEKGTNNYDAPYIFYTNDEGKVKAGLNLKEGAVEYANLSEYEDPETGLKVRSFLITDHSMWEEGKKRYELDEINEGDLSKALFRYTLPLNNMATNHEQELLDMIGIPFPRNKVWGINALSNGEILNIQEKAREVFRDDYNALSEDETLTIETGRIGKVELTNEKHLDVIYRVNYSSKYSTRSHSDGFYTDWGFFQVADSAENRIEIDINTDDYYERIEKTLVAGIVTETIRSMTAGGMNLSIIYRSLRDEMRTFTDNMMYEVCNTQELDAYTKSLGGGFFEKGIVPCKDWVTPVLPRCLTSTGR